MKIVLIGGGSFVFAPTVLEDAIVKHRLSECELILVDPNAEAVNAMVGVGRRVGNELGVSIKITASSDRKASLPGTDYVIVSASPQGARRWMMDYDILKQVGTPDQARECGGVGGMLNAFRSITLLIDICRDMEIYCPNAVLFDVTNPMPRVITAIDRYTSIKAIGFCNIAYRGEAGYEFLPRLIGKEPNEVQVTTGGLNHFAWLLDIKDRKDGNDLMPVLKQYLLEGKWRNQPDYVQRELTVMRRWFERYGGIAAGSVEHHAEYLPLEHDIHYATTPPYHGNESERRQRLEELNAIAAGNNEWSSAFAHRSWEHPVDVAVALHERSTCKFDILNIRNRGYISNIPDGRIVEVQAMAVNGELIGIAVPDLPKGVAEICLKISDVHELVAEAAVKGSAAIAKQAIEIDPAIIDKKAANLALDQMLKVHADLIPQFQ